MGDRLRQLLYPLLLPVIVGTVWLCGWVRQQEDRMERIVRLPPEVAARQTSIWARQATDDEDGDVAAADQAPDDSGALATVSRAGVDEP